MTQVTEPPTSVPSGFAIEFDFANKAERPIPLDQVPQSCAAGLFCWVDIDAQADPAGATAILKGLGVNEHAIEEALGPDVDGRHDVYEDCLHIAVTSGTFNKGEFAFSHVDIVIGQRFLVTLRRGRVEFIEQVRRHYRQDFLNFAQSPSFLVYEYFDHLIETYRKSVRGLSAYVEQMQSRIFGSVDDTIFNEVSGVTRDLLSFRKTVLAVREVLHQLATRRSPFISATSQPFLDRMVGTLERLCSDLGVEREILSETLNLYMGIVSHRTNRVVNRLTIISMIFLPLTFLCGVYGMNFGPERMPELNWGLGYLFFWIMCIIIAGGLLLLMRRKKWL